MLEFCYFVNMNVYEMREREREIDGGRREREYNIIYFKYENIYEFIYIILYFLV